MSAPELSVVIATRGRRALLQRCLTALESQTLAPERFEVVIGDDGSSDGTQAMLERLSPPFALRSVPSPGRGKGEAQNAAIAAARGAVCLLLDDDVLAEPELLAAHLQAHRARPRLVGLGRLEQAAPAGGDWYASAFARAWNRHFDSLERSQPSWSSCYGGNLSAPRAELLAVGGLATDLPLVNDFELGFRLWRAGCTFAYLPRAAAVHLDVKPAARLLADARAQGGAQVLLAEREPEMAPALLGWFRRTSWREIALRRALLAARVSPRALARLGPLVPGEGRRAIWCDFVARLAFWGGVRDAMPRERWCRLTQGVPVLMYHAFGERGERGEPDRYVIARRELARQLRLARLLGYRFIAFEELVDCLREHRLPPRRALVITIDDGYRDNLEVAGTLLRRRRARATIFLISGRLGGVNDWTAEGALARRPLLSRAQLQELDGAVLFGAHTRTHPVLPALGDEQLAAEITGSREDLEQALGRPVRCFAYPFGEHDARVVQAARAAGFLGACTTEPRLSQPDDDPLRIPRLEIKAGDSLARFVLKLIRGGA